MEKARSDKAEGSVKLDVKRVRNENRDGQVKDLAHEFRPPTSDAK
ncbi:MAG: hypothetical protein ACRBN8_32055 [Nannocystales bacterium]